MGVVKIQGWHRRAAVGAFALVALLAVVLVVWLATGTTDPSPADAQESASPAATAAATTPSPRWESVGGVRLPFSTVHGPRSTDLGRAGGYTRDQAGAALAAAQVLLRTTPEVGSNVFLPVLPAQVTGANAPVMRLHLLEQYAQLRAGTDVAEGAPIPGLATVVEGYVIRSLDTGDDGPAGAAVVDVVLGSPALRARSTLVAFTVSLQWSYGDWRVLAPPLGDWGQVATALTAPPVGMLPYDEIG